jgi:hypothetical protein
VEFTLYLAIGTAVLAGIGGLQLLVFGYQAVQLQRTVKAAKESADALINIERPWLLVTSIGTKSDFMDDGRHVTFAYFVIKNYGNSPAWIMEMGGTFDTIPSLSALPTNPIYKHTENEANRGIVLGKPKTEDDQQSFRFPHNRLSLQVLPRVKEEIWCVYGFVTYKDIFGKTHETRFCSVLDQWPHFKFVDVGPKYNLHT